MSNEKLLREIRDMTGRIEMIIASLHGLPKGVAQTFEAHLFSDRVMQNPAVVELGEMDNGYASKEWDDLTNALLAIKAMDLSE